MLYNGNRFFPQLSNEFAFVPNALSGFAGVAIGILIANFTGII